MKKVVLLLIAAVGLTTTSCGYSGSVKTDTDSLAYAIGLDMGTSLWKNVDSTMNVDLVCKGIKDAFAKEGTMTPEQTQEYIRYYFTTVMPKKKAAANEKVSADFMSAAAKVSGIQKTTSGLMYVIETAGAEPKVSLGDTVVAHYVLTDASGKQLQSSRESGNPMTYANTEGAMIKGFSEGVAMLGQGGKATLYIPYDLAYGEEGNGMIGPKQSLKFEVEIVRVAKPADTVPVK